MYKYVLFKDGRLQKWEDGFDRIIDLELLPEIAFIDNDKFRLGQSPQLVKSALNQVKKVELLDEWETFSVCFSVFKPKLTIND